MGNFIDEFRDSDTAQKMADILAAYDGRAVRLMEVCGTHTMSISRYGIRGLMPEKIRLLSGPGCPVCVTPGFFIDSAIELSRESDVVIATFGDLMRVPGSCSSLLKEKAEGGDIRIVYSPLDCIKLAAEMPDKKLVFLSVGFETTTPVSALSILKASEMDINNFSVLSANKTMPEALKLLASDKELGIDGFIYPGHVSAVIGTALYEELAEKYGVPGVVAGFEPLDVLNGIICLASIINDGKKVVENRYSRVVRSSGNPIAVEKMNEVFEPEDSVWRGIGCIPGSGLKIRDKYGRYDAWRVFGIEPGRWEEPKGCMCGDVLKGKATPVECRLFGTKCTPENPVGACMVSSEGTCAAYHRYGGR